MHQNLGIPQCTTCCLKFLKAIIWSWPSQLMSQNTTTFFRPWHHLVAGMISVKTSAPSLDAAGIRRRVFVKIPSGQIFHKKEFSLQSNMLLSGTAWKNKNIYSHLTPNRFYDDRFFRWSIDFFQPSIILFSILHYILTFFLKSKLVLWTQWSKKVLI